MFDFIDSSIDVHDLPNVLEARKIRKLVPKNDVSLRGFCHMAPSKKKVHKIPVRTVPELAPKTFWRPNSYRFQDSNTNNQHVLIKNPTASQLPKQIITTAHLNYPKYNGMLYHRRSPMVF